MRHLPKILLMALISFCTLLPGLLKAQVGIHSEADQIKMAQKNFDNKEYSQALPMYSQIVSNHPENVMYNYYLGVCLLKVDGDKADAVRFLSIATKSPEVPFNAWLYLGKAQHQAYRFDEAIQTLQTYRKSAGKQVWRESGGEALIVMCQNAINLNNDLSLMRHSILKEQEMNITEFVTGYKNVGQAGRFLKLPKEYETKQAKDQPESAFIFLSANGNCMVYAAPGKTGATGFDIFIVTKDSKGLWKFPEAISSEINTGSDEAFPVLVNDGKTLYFSSRGHQSTGGYDVFRSDYVATTGNWSVPVPMGSPVNSPGDDVYYVPLSDTKTAYFSSDRESPSGKCKVYTASVIDDTRNFVTINGTFVCPAGLDLSDAKVTILNAEDRSLLAQFRTATLNGNYLLKLPAPSKLIFEVKIPGFGNLESEVLFNATTPVNMIQEILVKRDDKGKETIRITTTEIETTSPIMVQNDVQLSGSDSHNNTASSTKSSANATSENEKTPLISIVNTDTKTTEPNNKVESKQPVSAENNASPQKAPSVTEKEKIASTSPATETAAANTLESVKSSSANTDAHPSGGSVISEDVAVSKVATDSKTVHKNDKSGVVTTNPIASTETKDAAVTPQLITDTKTSASIEEFPLISIVTETSETNPSGKNRTSKSKKEKNNKLKATTEPAPIAKAEEVAQAIPTPQTPPQRPTLQDVKFKVQLGAFKNRTESELKKKFEATGLTQLEYIKNGEGLLIVVAGNETDYDSATRLKETAVKRGISDAFVVVYSGENRLPVSMVVFEED
ncbi:MAG: tetratricopeptide repeat protein [Bacteroidota bacterium]|nr:tetratricopeptide repeat protein [Bacteroidota bacterium]